MAALVSADKVAGVVLMAAVEGVAEVATLAEEVEVEEILSAGVAVAEAQASRQALTLFTRQISRLEME